MGSREWVLRREWGAQMWVITLEPRYGGLEFLSHPFTDIKLFLFLGMGNSSPGPRPWL